MAAHCATADSDSAQPFHTKIAARQIISFGGSFLGRDHRGGITCFLGGKYLAVLLGLVVARHRRACSGRRTGIDSSNHKNAAICCGRGHCLCAIVNHKRSAGLGLCALCSQRTGWGNRPAFKTTHTRNDLRPFSGIAFLWFVGVVRNRLGSLEDRFFATIFLGSGLLYVAMMFTGGAVPEAALTLLATRSDALLSSGSFDLAREEVFRITSIYATKMAGVFMISTSTIFMQTRVVPRWIALLGYGLALVHLLSAVHIRLLAAVFPLWVMIISMWILVRGSHSRLPS